MNYRHFLIAVLICILAAACAPKQEIQPTVIEETRPAEELKPPETPPQPETAGEKKAEPPAEKKPEEQYVMLNFENADLETVIATIGEMLKINYILAPGVTGKITIQSHNKVAVSELFSTFQTILEFNGFTAVKYGNFYRIVSIDTAKQQPVPVESGKTPLMQKDAGFMTQEVPLEYVKANDVANIVRNLMPRGTDIVVYEPSNMLIVTAPPAGIMKFLKLLEAIDIPASDREVIKTFVYYVENGEAKKLVDILKNIYASKKAGAPTPVRTVTPSPAAPQPPAPGLPTRARQTAPVPTTTTTQEGLAGEIEGDIVIEAYEDINAILVKSTPRGFLTLLETIKKLDIQPKQVLIEVLVAEISLTNNTQFGIEWLLKGSTQIGNENIGIVGGFTTSNLVPQFDVNQNRFVLPGTTSTSDGGTTTTSGILSHPSDVFATIINPAKFSALITAAASKGDVKVLASPNILALDNKEAKIEIGSEVPVATSITQPLAGAGDVGITATSQVQFKTVGTLLTVTPHINEKKQVTLKISQEVSSIGASVSIGGQDFTGFNTRKANTTAIVQDGHTLVIGGIISENEDYSRRGIPLLSDIPLLGHLFGVTRNGYTRTELIVLVTPHVIANKDEADELTKDLKNRVKDLRERLKKREDKLRKGLEEAREEEKEEESGK